jgi:hypothetical protein
LFLFLLLTSAWPEHIPVPLVPVLLLTSAVFRFSITVAWNTLCSTCPYKHWIRHQGVELFLSVTNAVSSRSNAKTKIHLTCIYICVTWVSTLTVHAILWLNFWHVLMDWWCDIIFILFAISLFLLMTGDDIARCDWYLIPLSTIYIYFPYCKCQL